MSLGTALTIEYSQKFLTRFFQKIESIDSWYDCWYWKASLNRAGYGTFRVDARVVVAHKVMWAIFHRGYVPQGICICHHCDNPPCVNPFHLFTGTRSDNQIDSFRKNRGPGQRLIVADVFRIRNSNEMGITLAKRFNVSTATISEIRNRRTWNHLH